MGAVALLTVMLLAPMPSEALKRHDSDSVAPPANWESRRTLLDYIVAPIGDLLSLPSGVATQRSTEHRVKFGVHRSAEHLYLLFLNELKGEFPIYSAGSFIVKRRISDGSFEQLKIFLRNDPQFFARIVPNGSMARLDVAVAGSLLYRDIPLPFSFESILVRPFAEVIEGSATVVDWPLLLAPVEPSDYDAMRRITEQIRPLLAELPDREDGAMDAEGNLVFIETLGLQENLPGFNCSGFAKWVADGLYRPLTGRYLDIETLKRKRLDIRGHRWSRRREEERDPYFGLDWSRNIALALLDIEIPGIDHDPEAGDVREAPFSDYVEDVGYPVDELERILYFLALHEPGYFYIGSINREFGSAPVLRQHLHLVVLFPYFEQDGRFRAVVMERNVETNLDNLHDRYANDSYVHLVRVRAGEAFMPPTPWAPAAE